MTDLKKIPVGKIIILSGDVDKLVLPDGYELKKVDTKAEKIVKLQKEIDELKDWEEPTDKELIEEGRMNHPYYMNQMMIEYLQNQIKKLE